MIFLRVIRKNMMSKKLIFIIVGVMALALIGAAIFARTGIFEKKESPTPPSVSEDMPGADIPTPPSTQYLTFQIFTNAPSPETPAGPSAAEIQSGTLHVLSGPPTKEAIQKMVRGIKAKIGTTGDARRKLGFVAGPLALDYTDVENTRLIRDVFAIAREENVAVGLHLDDSMFWGKRKNLWNKVENVEWLDWNKTPNTGRRIDWAPFPVKFPPQMCFNSPNIQQEIQRFAGVIGREVQQQADRLKAEDKAELFAGVIAGWETQIGRDFDTNKYLGYCALTNKGFSAVNPPKDIDREREKIVKEFIELWAKALTEAGIPRDKIYAHIALPPKSMYVEMKARDPSKVPATYSQFAHFVSPSTAFSDAYGPGFSIYGKVSDEIYHELRQQSARPWASSEGTATGIAMRTYLDGLFNRGATLVNIFAWGIGPYSPENMLPWATGRPEAIAVYQKFLRGETLAE